MDQPEPFHAPRVSMRGYRPKIGIWAGLAGLAHRGASAHVSSFERVNKPIWVSRPGYSRISRDLVSGRSTLLSKLSNQSCLRLPGRPAGALTVHKHRCAVQGWPKHRRQGLPLSGARRTRPSERAAGRPAVAARRCRCRVTGGGQRSPVISAMAFAGRRLQSPASLWLGIHQGGAAQQIELVPHPPGAGPSVGSSSTYSVYGCFGSRRPSHCAEPLPNEAAPPRGPSPAGATEVHPVAHSSARSPV